MTYYEIFCDESNFHLWAIRKKGVTSFNETMHAMTKGDAEQIAAELDRLQDRNADLVRALGERNEQLNEVCDELKHKDRHIRELNNLLEQVGKEGTLASMEVGTLKAENSELRAEIERLQESVSALKIELGESNERTM